MRFSRSLGEMMGDRLRSAAKTGRGVTAVALLVACQVGWAAEVSLEQRPDFGADSWIVDLTRTREIQLQTSAPLPVAVSPMTSYSRILGPVGRPNLGVLTGKVIYLLGGHGRTYNEEDFYWISQRNPMNGMVEDYGNQDQASMFAEVALRAGATIAPIRPLHHQPLERVLSMGSPGVKLYGDWVGVAEGKTYRGTAPEGSSNAAWSRVNRRATAVARFEPFIPKSDFYPVYVWAPAGPDRAITAYHVHHPGGLDRVVVNHRMVGHGWIYLGRYYFPRGVGYGVEISNEAVDAGDADFGRKVVADTIRFGNGLGDAVRPGGISGFSREDEASIYWMKDSGGGAAEKRLHSVGADRSNTVGAPPRYAAYMNRETEGTFADRLYLSFHSNASGSRGALGLWVRDPNNRPDHQELLAELTGRAINVGLLEENLPGLAPWFRRTRHQLNHITFGELRRDFIQNEMSSTIMETAFFDQPDDARWMTDPRGLTLLAQGTLAGVIEWFQALERPGIPILLPPPAPEEITASQAGPGQIQLRFVQGRTGLVRGGAPSHFEVEFSEDGYAFGPPRRLAGASPTSTTLPLDFVSTATAYLRLRAVNSSGQSLPSTVAPVRLTTGTADGIARLLLVDGVREWDGSLNQRQTQVWGRDPDNVRSVDRVRPMELLDSMRLVRLAGSLKNLPVAFDFASPADLADGRIQLGQYRAVIYDADTVLADFQPMPTAVAAALGRYANSGGKVIAFGSSLVHSISQDGADGAELLRKAFAAQSLKEGIGITRGVVIPQNPEKVIEFEVASSALPLPRSWDALVPTNAGREAIRWSASGGAAAIVGPHGLVAAFSPASIGDSREREKVLRLILSVTGILP